jgi:pimeloyl-ACP methyl ester carboxylesterase
LLFIHGASQSHVCWRKQFESPELSSDRASIYPGVGHMPQWEAPDRFNAELRDFARFVRTLRPG